MPVSCHCTRRSPGPAGPAAAAGFAGRALTTIGLAVIALCALATLAAGALIGLLAGGFASDDPARDIAVTATRLALPAIAVMTLAALIGAVLAAHGRFLAISLSPLVVNLAMIALLAAPLLGLAPTPKHMAFALAATMSLGSLMQLALLARALRRLPGAVRLSRPAFDADQRRLVRLAFPALIAAAGSQLLLLAAMPAASTMPGALAFLHYAERVFLLPLGLIAALAGIVLLPRLAYQAATGMQSGFRTLARRARSRRAAARASCHDRPRPAGAADYHGLVRARRLRCGGVPAPRRDCSPASPAACPSRY